MINLIVTQISRIRAESNLRDHVNSQLEKALIEISVKRQSDIFGLKTVI